MSISDEMIFYYFKLLTNISEDELKKIKLNLKNSAKNPRDIKVELAKNIIAIYHNKKSADNAEEEFNKIFRDKQKPTDIEEKREKAGKYKLVDLLPKLELTNSKSSSRILVQQGGVRIDDIVQKDFDKEIEVKNGMIVQVGKRRFVKIKI